MPRSRSRSMLSITRSATCWLARNDAALPQQRVDQRGLAVVDVRDDGDVAPERVGDLRGLSVCETSSQYIQRGTLTGPLAGYACLFARASRGLDDSVAGPISSVTRCTLSVCERRGPRCCWRQQPPRAWPARPQVRSCASSSAHPCRRAMCNGWWSKAPARMRRSASSRSACRCIWVSPAQARGRASSASIWRRSRASISWSSRSRNLTARRSRLSRR